MENRSRYLLLFRPLAIGRMCVADDSGGMIPLPGSTLALTTMARPTSAGPARCYRGY